MNYNQLEYQRNTGLLQTEDERQMGMFLHFSALANMIIPFAGYVIPVVIWQTKKQEMPAIEAHGKEAVNWMITSFIYNLINIIVVVLGILFLAVAEIPAIGIILIGLGLLVIFGLSITSIIYAIYGGIRASKGEHWDYPLNINFLK